jgi:hypothetical protein
MFPHYCRIRTPWLESSINIGPWLTYANDENPDMLSIRLHVRSVWKSKDHGLSDIRLGLFFEHDHREQSST